MTCQRPHGKRVTKLKIEIIDPNSETPALTMRKHSQQDQILGT